MTYCARYRFTLLTPLEVEKGKPVDVAIPGLPSVTFEMGEEAYPVGHWAIARIGGFATEEEARRVGQRLGDILLVVGAVTKLGIDVGFSRPSTVRFGEAVRAAVRKETGEELHGETHGLMVYEEGAVAFMNFQARGSVQIPAGAFEERLGNWAEPSSGLTERQRNCAALINDSLFVPQSEGQFILRISAVEALCEQTVLDPRYLSAIEQLEQQLASQTLDEEIRKTLQVAVPDADREQVIVGLSHIGCVIAQLSGPCAHQFEHCLPRETPRILWMHPVRDEGQCVHPLAALQRDWDHALNVDCGRLLPLA